MVKDRKFIAHRSALQEIMKICNMIRNNPGNNLNSKEETKRLKILNTVFPWYSSLIHSVTHDECQNQWIPNKKHFLLQGSVATHTSSTKCNKSRASAKCCNIFFLVKIQWVQGLTSSEAGEYQGMTICR